MHSETEIGLSDLIRAIGVLRPDREALQEVRKIFGLKPGFPEETQIRKPPFREGDGGVSEFHDRIKSSDPTWNIAAPLIPSAWSDVLVRRRSQRTTLSELREDTLPPEQAEASTQASRKSAEKRSVFDGVIPLPIQSEANLPRLPHEPLLAPRWSRSILSAALAVPGSPMDGKIAIDEIIDAVAHFRPLLRLPRLPVPTLAKGVQVLVDLGRSMTPFLKDQMHLIGELRDVVGQPLLEVLRFAGCPSLGAGRGMKHTWRRYSGPPAGTPVLVISDFGIGFSPVESGAGDPNQQWLDWAADVRRAGCSIIALCPYGPARWPRELSRAITILEWDRRTSILTVRKAMRRRRVYRQVGQQ